MGCNAHNHSRSCNCGWGGVNYFTPTRPSIVPWLNGYGTYESFTIPNARCPVCGDQVFFYRSPTGGSVFFDGLGPPWPKHPCTSRSISKPLRSNNHPNARKIVKLECEKDGWLPIQVTNIAVSGVQNTVEISISLPQSIQTVYVAFNHELLDQTAPWLIKLTSDPNADNEDSYLLQTLVSPDSRSLKVTEIELRAYRDISSAQFGRNRQRGPASRRSRERNTTPISVNSLKPITNILRPTLAEKKAAAQDLLKKLKDKYPVISDFRPLPKGVEKQIIRRDPALPKDILQLALQAHRNAIEYLINMAAGGTYYQIDGTAGAQVSEQQIRQAELQLGNKKKKTTFATTNPAPSNIGLNPLKLNELMKKFNG